MMYLHDRYQAFCRWCHKVKEADSTAEAVRAVEEHEKGCPRKPKAREEAAK